MNSSKGTRGKKSLMTVLSLSLLIIGFGSVSWALFNIGTPVEDSMDDSMDASEPPSVESRLYRIPNLIDVVSHEVKLEPIKHLPTKHLPTKNQSLPHMAFKEGERIGRLEIPVLKRKLPLVEGTTDESLKIGVGHFSQSVMPGVSDNCVISGHRDTVFRRIGELKIGDALIVKTSYGAFTYEVTGTRIVHKDDRTVIVPTDHAVLTLTTCYPFHFIGNAPERYIVSADLVKTVLIK